VIAGDHQPPAVHALVHAINHARQYGKTVFYSEPVDANPVNRGESLHSLVEDMRAGKVDLLLILGGNPAYDAPAQLEFASALKSNAVNLKVFSARIATRRPSSASGMCPKRTISNLGAMRAPTTEPSASFSR
jgi:hypothetical protein